VAKTRAQRKAERRAREAELERQRRRQGGDGDGAERERVEEGRAQQDTQMGVSGEVAEAEAAMQTGTTPEDLESPAPSRADVGVPTEDRSEAPAEPLPEAPPEPLPEAPQEPVPEAPPEPAPEAPAEQPEQQLTSKERKRLRRAQQREERRAPRREAAREEKRRGPVLGFLASCWAELKRVQWPDRDTLVQASAVTIIFVAVAAAYLGALDAAFNQLIKLII
jgi:preprotein translocase SecE subunit